MSDEMGDVIARIRAADERFWADLAEFVDDETLAELRERRDMPTAARLLDYERLIERLRIALLAIAPLAEVPGTPLVVREKLLGNIRKALRP